MAKIKLDNLSKPKNLKYSPTFTFADVEVDFKFENVQSNELNSSLFKSDLVGNYDLGAIKNSIVNIFTTFPGDKLLNPEFGLNLNQFLFFPCNTDTAQLIGEEINKQIVKQEPRVNVRKVTVTAEVNNDQYRILLELEVPFINNNNSINFNALLNSTGITFYN